MPGNPPEPQSTAFLGVSVPLLCTLSPLGPSAATPSPPPPLASPVPPQPPWVHPQLPVSQGLASVLTWPSLSPPTTPSLSCPAKQGPTPPTSEGHSPDLGPLSGQSWVLHLHLPQARPSPTPPPRAWHSVAPITPGGERPEAQLISPGRGHRRGVSSIWRPQDGAGPLLSGSSI